MKETLIDDDESWGKQTFPIGMIPKGDCSRVLSPRILFPLFFFFKEVLHLHDQVSKLLVEQCMTYLLFFA